jgi:membrane-bound lytic murein transglycosylase F
MTKCSNRLPKKSVHYTVNPNVSVMRQVWAFYILLVVSAMCTRCGQGVNSSKHSPFPEPVFFDLDSIRQRGRLILLTENSASTYYLYRGQAKGFDFEMIKALAKHLNVRLEVKILDDVDQMFAMLNKGEGDIIASNLTALEERQRVVNFTSPVYQTRQILVQRKYDRANPDSLFPLIQDTTELSRTPLWVHRYSSFYHELKRKSALMGGQLEIHEAPGEISTDDLIRLTADGQIPATVTDENLATLQHFDYPELDMSVALTPPQNIAFAVRKNAPGLLGAIDEWLALPVTQNKLKRTFEKYFSLEKQIGYRGPFKMPIMGDGAISPYDSLFFKYAKELGWDWELLAALAFQESRFNPYAESWSGASGIMQLMPETAARFGCDSLVQAEQNIRAGVRYIKYLDRFWKERIADKNERIKFVLASYNIGPGHILDAQNIAQALGKPDTIWHGHVAECLLLKTQEKFYTMEGVKHGYCHAKEPYEFVSKVFSIYEYYFSLRPPRSAVEQPGFSFVH